jgi:hypothetical protein
LLVLLLGLCVSHVVALGLYYGERRQALATAGGRFAAERIAAAVRMVDETPQPARPALVRSLWRPRLTLTWTRTSVVREEGPYWRTRLIRGALGDALGDLGGRDMRIAYRDVATGSFLERDHPWAAMREHLQRMTEHGMGPPPRHLRRMMEVWRRGAVLAVSVRLNDGSWLNFASPTLRIEPFWASEFFLAFLAMTVVVLVLTVWAVRRATQPLALFARAAERLGRDVNAPALAEEGPSEVISGRRSRG